MPVRCKRRKEAAADIMDGQIEFQELGQFFSEHGVSINLASRITGVSRNTLTKIVKGASTRPATIGRIINRLESSGYETSQLLSVLRNKQQSIEANVQRAAAGAPRVVSSDGEFAAGYLARRARAALEEAESWVARLRSRIEQNDHTFARDDLLAVVRSYKKLAIDIGDIDDRLKDRL